MPKQYTLFHARFAGSTAILWALRELGVPHELVELDYDDVVARKDSEPFRRMKKVLLLCYRSSVLGSSWMWRHDCS